MCLMLGPQLQEVSCKMFAASVSLRSLHKFLPNSTKVALTQLSHLLSLLCNILFNPLTPCYKNLLKSCFSCLHKSHPKLSRSSAILKLKMPGHITKFLDHSFCVQIVRSWNTLSVAIRHAQILTAFKR